MSYLSKTEPRPNQLKEFEENRDKHARGLFWQMRSGKSKAAIDLADYLFRMGEITAVLIWAPNGVHSNWLVREFPTHCHSAWKGHYWDSKKAKTKAHKEAVAGLQWPGDGKTLSVLTVNSETIFREAVRQSMGDFILGHKGKVLLIVDESHDFRSPSSKRSKVARRFSQMLKWKRILTGTPDSNSPLALWSQLELLEPGALGYHTFTEFKQRYAIVRMTRTRSGRQFEQIVGYRDQDELQGRLAQWVSVVLKEDAGIQPLNDEPVEFVLPDKVRKLYDDVKKNYMLEDQILEGGALMGKLQQISRGWYYREDGEVVELAKPKDNPAYASLLDLVNNTPQKSIVWCRHRYEIEQVEKFLRENGIGCVTYMGGMKNVDKEQVKAAFNNDRAIKVLVGQPKSAGVGLDFSVAGQIVWFSHVNDLIDYEQASERASAAWKEHGVDVFHLIAKDTVDWYILDSHRSKADLSDELTGPGLQNLLAALEMA